MSIRMPLNFCLTEKRKVETWKSISRDKNNKGKLKLVCPRCGRTDYLYKLDDGLVVPDCLLFDSEKKILEKILREYYGETEKTSEG
ncbi:MAG: hypothetical protein V5A64_07250 [Candidatus Thermoplasmatota archaeon]